MQMTMAMLMSGDAHMIPQPRWLKILFTICPGWSDCFAKREMNA